MTLALGALASRWINNGIVDYPMTLAKRVDVAYPVYAPKWHHSVEVTATEEEHLNSCLSKRLNHSLWVPSSREVCDSLVGGRLLPGEVRLVAPVYARKSDGCTAHALRNWYFHGRDHVSSLSRRQLA